MSKGGEVWKVEEVTKADRTQDWTLDLCVRLVVEKWLGFGLVTGRCGKKVIGRAVVESDRC